MPPKRPLDDPSQDSASPPAFRAPHHQQQQQQLQHCQQVILISGPPSHPLLLPEILQIIGHHLDSAAVSACLRVCSLWHQAFVHIPWKEVKVSYPLPLHNSEPDFLALLRHAHFTQTLHLTACAPIPAGLCCPKLTVLDLDHDTYSLIDEPPLNEAKERLFEFLCHHGPKLTHFGYHSKTTPEILDMISSLLSAVPSLSFLSLHCESVIDWLSRHDSLISENRTVLSLRGPIFESRSSDGKYPIETVLSMVQEVQDGIDRTWHTRLRDLRLETEFYDMVMFECHFGLIRKSPDLVRLYWTKDFFQSSYPKKARFGDQMARMAEEIRGRQGFSCPWRRLEALSLPGLEFDRDDFAIVIEALSPTLQELHLNWTSFDDDTWEALRAGGLQLQTCLRILNLRHCKWLLGLTVQDIMCTMQGLEVFSADWISDTDAVIEASRHWVCTQMRELSIGIVLCENTTEPHILKRLSELRQLEVLNLSLPQTAVNAYNEWMLEDGHEPQREVEDDLDLKLTLEQGLDALKTLKKLRVLELPGRVPMKTWSVEEAKWIKHHWPRLEKIVGKKQDNEEIRLMLADVWDW